MTKPIAYYLSDRLDAETIDVIGTTYGGRLEQLDRGQKHALLIAILDEIWNRPLSERNFVPTDLIRLIRSLSTDTLLGLTIATADYLREPNDGG